VNGHESEDENDADDESQSEYENEEDMIVREGSDDENTISDDYRVSSSSSPNFVNEYPIGKAVHFDVEDGLGLASGGGIPPQSSLQGLD